MKRFRGLSIVGGALGVTLVLAAAGWSALLWQGHGRENTEVAGYATSLAKRSDSQRRNARIAAQSLNGAVIRPGEVFSFNSRVKGWSQDDGYVKAPVSFDGELVRAYGGGVCQTSTTLYNAALLAGLPIVERHSHEFRPAYAIPGRDAAVAYPGVDLRFRNTYPWPLRIEAKAKGDVLSIRLLGDAPSNQQVRLQTEVLSASRPERRVQRLAGTGRIKRNVLRSPGLAGGRVAAYRLFLENGVVVRREKLSDDTYAAMDRVISLVP